MKKPCLGNVIRPSAILLLLLIFIVAGCAMKPLRDTVQLKDQDISKVITGEPALTWQSPFMAKEVDLVRFVHDDKLLVGTMELTGMGQIWAPEEMDLILYEINHGKVVWSIPRKSLDNSLEEVNTTESGIVLTGISSDHSKYVLHSLDIATGSLLWERKAETSSSRIRVFPWKDVAIFATPEGSDLKLSGVGLSSGNDLWSVRIPRFLDSEEAEYGVMISGENILLVGNKAVQISVSTGKALWEVPFTRYESTSFVMESDGENLIISDGESILAIDVETGQVKWNNSAIKGNFILAYLTEEKLFVIERGEEASEPCCVIRCLNLKNGQNYWAKALSERIRSPLNHYDSTLFYTTSDQLYALNASTGTTKFVAELPESMNVPVGLPDKLIVSENLVIVAREVGMAAFSVKNGNLTYTGLVDGSEPFTYGFLNHKLLSRVSSSGGSDTRLAAITGATSNLAIQTANINLRMSQLQLDYTMSQTQSILDSPTSSSYERQAALTQRQVAIQTNYAIGVSAAQAQLTSAVANLGQSMVGIAMAFRQAWVQGSLNIDELKVENSYITHNLSIQQGYYIRPFYDDGWGITLIRLKDGKRADIYVSSHNEPLLINGANLPVFLISPNGKQIIAKGLGVLNRGMPSYIKSGWPANITFFPDKFQIPYPSMLSYDLSQVAFSKVSQRRKKAKSRDTLSDLDRQFLRAVFTPDLEEAKRLLQEGANINAIDEYGYNALFYGALVDDKKLVKFLIDNGCDPTVRDATGWLAWHYSFMTNPNPKCTNMLAKAVKKAKGM